MTVQTIAHGSVAGYTAGCRCDACVPAWKAYQTQWRANRLADPECPHGNRVTYLSGCRCEECRQANAAYNMARKAKLRSAKSVPHGTIDGYSNYSCRCVECTAAKRADTRNYYIRNHVAFLERAKKRKWHLRRDARRVTAADIAKMFNRFGGRCAYCGSDDRIEVDHVIPISRGGRHAIGNLVPACIYCNRSKNDSLLIEWKRRPR